MYEVKKMERYLPVNLLGRGPRLVEKEFTGPRSDRGSETLHNMCRKTQTQILAWGNYSMLQDFISPVIDN